jgi:hypothetical protein
MKSTSIILTVCFLLAFLALTGCEQSVNTPVDTASEPAQGGSTLGKIEGINCVHRVSGSGWVEEGPVSFRVSVSAAQGEDGSVMGILKLTLDLTKISLGIVQTVQEVTCLTVEGKSAWIGARVFHTTSPILPVGTETITLIRDLGGKEEDVMHGETLDFFPSGTQCSDKPSLHETVISKGNYEVR